MRNPTQTDSPKPQVGSTRSTFSFLAFLSVLLLVLSTVASYNSFGARNSRLAQYGLSFASYPMLSPAGNVSTYSDHGYTIPSTSFVAGSSVYVKGEKWPAYANINVSFTQGVQGTPVVVATNVAQTNDLGTFTTSFRIGSRGPVGLWNVIAEYGSNDNSSSTFIVYLPVTGPPSVSTPVWLAALLIAGAVIGYFWHRRRVERSKYPNYYSSKSSQR